MEDSAHWESGAGGLRGSALVASDVGCGSCAAECGIGAEEFATMDWADSIAVPNMAGIAKETAAPRRELLGKCGVHVAIPGSR